MRRLLALASVLLLSLVSPAGGAGHSAPQLGSPEWCASHLDDPTCLGVAGNGDVLTVDGRSATQPSAGKPHTGDPVSLPTVSVVHQYAPTCTGNSRFDVQVLCSVAISTCQPAGTGLVQYWKWTVTTDLRTGVVTVVQEPGAVCLGPDDPVVSPVAAIGGVLARDLQKLIVLKGTARVKPSGTTLVNYDTGFYTEAGRYVLDPVQILGRTVVVTAIPQSYDWYFGDGTSALDAGPGQPDQSDVRHTYRRSGSVAPYVVITWTGTFTVDGGAQQAVVGTAQTTGPGTPLQVKQARAELVTG